MEEETLKAQAGWEAPQNGLKDPAVPFAQNLSGISFVPVGTSPREEVSPKDCVRYAVVGTVLGALALSVFFIIALSIVLATLGALFSYLGLRSSYARFARVGLTLSIAGGLASVIYMVAVYAGMINYNYFTNELWGIPAGGVQVLE